MYAFSFNALHDIKIVESNVVIDVHHDVNALRRRKQNSKRSVNRLHAQEFEESMLRHKLLSIATSYKRKINHFNNKVTNSVTMSHHESWWKIFDLTFLAQWIQIIAFVNIYTIYSNIPDVTVQCWVVKDTNDQFWLIFLSLLFLFCIRFYMFCILLFGRCRDKHARACSISKIETLTQCVLVGSTLYTNTAMFVWGIESARYIFDAGCLVYFQGWWMFALVGNIVFVVSMINPQRFNVTTQNQSYQCYDELIKWLWEKNENCDTINIKNDTVIRLIAINLCIDCQDKRLNDCFDNIDMETINSIIDNETKVKMPFCDFIDTFDNLNNNSNDNDRYGYADSVSVQMFFLYQPICSELIMKMNWQCCNCDCDAQQCIMSVSPILLFLHIISLLFHALVIFFVVPEFMIATMVFSKGYEFSIGATAWVIAYFVSSIICCCIVLSSIKKKLIEWEIAPTFATFDNKVDLHPIDLECIKNCYQSMISYKIKCQILQTYLFGIQDLADIILSYLPQLGEVKFDIANQLINDDHDQSDQDNYQLIVRQPLLG